MFKLSSMPDIVYGKSSVNSKDISLLFNGTFSYSPRVCVISNMYNQFSPSNIALFVNKLNSPKYCFFSICVGSLLVLEPNSINSFKDALCLVNNLPSSWDNNSVLPTTVNVPVGNPYIYILMEIHNIYHLACCHYHYIPYLLAD